MAQRPPSVIFEGEEPSVPYGRRRYSSSPRSPFVRWLLSSGLAKSERSAQRMLVIFALVALAVSAYLFFFSGTEPAPAEPTPTSVEENGRVPQY